MKTLVAMIFGFCVSLTFTTPQDRPHWIAASAICTVILGMLWIGFSERAES